MVDNVGPKRNGESPHLLIVFAAVESSTVGYLHQELGKADQYWRSVVLLFRMHRADPVSLLRQIFRVNNSLQWLHRVDFVLQVRLAARVYPARYPIVFL